MVIKTQNHISVLTFNQLMTHPWVSSTGLMQGSFWPHQEYRWLLLQVSQSPNEAAEEGITASSDMNSKTGW